MLEEQWDINCYECGRFIFAEKRVDTSVGVKCIKGRYEDGIYDEKKDVFFCKECAARHVNV